MAENADDLWKANHSSKGIGTAVLYIISLLARQKWTED